MTTPPALGSKPPGSPALTDPTAIADDCWAFALRLYGKPGVGDACLALQGNANLDVMMLLVAAFAAARCNITLDAADIYHMDEICRPWRDGIVRPLRALRVGLKTGPLPAPSQASERLRVQIKASELAAERLENDLLAAWLVQKAPAASANAEADLGQVLRRVVAQAAGKGADALPAPLQAAIDTIVAAAKA